MASGHFFFRAHSSKAHAGDFIPRHLSPSGRIYSKIISGEKKSLFISQARSMLDGAKDLGTQVERLKFIEQHHLIDDPKALELLLDIYFSLYSIRYAERISFSGTFFHFHMCRCFILNLPRHLILPVYAYVVEVLRCLSMEYNVSRELTASIIACRSAGSHIEHTSLAAQKICKMFKLKPKDHQLLFKFFVLFYDTWMATDSLLDFYSLALLFHRVAIYIDPSKSAPPNVVPSQSLGGEMVPCLAYETQLDSPTTPATPCLLDAIGYIQHLMMPFKHSVLQIAGLSDSNLVILYNSAFYQFVKFNSFSQGLALFEFIKGHSVSTGLRPNTETFKLAFSLMMNEGVVSGSIKDALLTLYFGLETLGYPLDLCIHAAKVLFACRCLEDIKALYLRIKNAAPEIIQDASFESTFLSFLSTYRGIDRCERQLVRELLSLIVASSGKACRPIHMSSSSFLIGTLYRFNRRELGNYISHLPLNFLSECPMFFSYVLKLMVIDPTHRPLLLSNLNERFKIFDSYPEGSSPVDYRLGRLSSLFYRNHPQLAALIYYWETAKDKQKDQDKNLGVPGLTIRLRPKLQAQPALKPFVGYYMIRILYLEKNSHGILEYFTYFVNENQKCPYSWITNRTVDMLAWALATEHEWRQLCRLLVYFTNSETEAYGPIKPDSEDINEGKSASSKTTSKQFSHPLFVESKHLLEIPRLYHQFRKEIDTYPENLALASSLCASTRLADSCLQFTDDELLLMKHFLNNYRYVRDVRRDVLGRHRGFMELPSALRGYFLSLLGTPVIFVDFCDRLNAHHKKLHAYLGG